mmetsp:Transcript_1716/g.5240  ORF Transcript_1716/g.5240 Transcript_1716/m.5240 type:complete len:211 (+) Transcript_1716:182-814(+)
MIAASLMIEESSAGEKPSVFSAMRAKLTEEERRVVLACTRRTFSLPSLSGRGTRTTRSKRPGRVRASSRMSYLFVAAMMTIPLPWVSMPSMQASSWFNVCSPSSLRTICIPDPRLLPSASSSSKKMTQGAAFSARAKSSRTRAAPRPTNISTKSEPEAKKKGSLSRAAITRARRVFPVPGGPTSRRPLGCLAPRRRYLEGFCMISTSCIT